MSSLVAPPLHAQELCDRLANPIYRSNFEHAVKGESCYGEQTCDRTINVWDTGQKYEFVHFAHEEENKRYIERTFEEVILDLPKPFNQSFYYDADAPNFFILILTDDMVSEILAGNLPFIYLEVFNDVVLPGYKIGRCSGYIGLVDTDSYTEIVQAVVFIPANLKPARLRSCLMEETLNALGIANDPPGQASLFDNGNYRIGPRGIKASVQTELFLQDLYQIKADGFGSISEYADAMCNK
ncbi:MAG: DUF2927 domain-containing protein [Planktomarina sp.]